MSHKTQASLLILYQLLLTSGLNYSGKSYYFKTNGNNEFTVYNRIHFLNHNISDYDANPHTPFRPQNVRVTKKVSSNLVNKDPHKNGSSTKLYLDEEWNYDHKSNNKSDLPFFVKKIYENRNKNPNKTNTVRILFNTNSNSSSRIIKFNLESLKINENVSDADMYFYWPLENSSSIYKTSVVLRLYQFEKQFNNELNESNLIENPDIHKLFNVIYISKAQKGWQFSYHRNIIEYVSIVRSKRNRICYIQGAKPIIILLVDTQRKILFGYACAKRSCESPKSGECRYTSVNVNIHPTFKLKKPIDNWARGEENLGLLLTISSYDENKLISIYNDTNKGMFRTFAVLNIHKNETQINHAFNTSKDLESPDNSTLLTPMCSKKPWQVDFKQLHWDNLILYPETGFMAYHCTGKCHLSDDGRNHHIMNHYAMLRQLNNGHHGSRDKICCVPTYFQSLPIMYFDRFNNIVLKNYDDMIVDKCGCR